MSLHALKTRAICTLISLSVAAAFVPVSVSAEDAPPLPVSDSNNSLGWVFDETLSDEFNGSSLDETKWQAIPFTWAKWRWEDKNVSVSGGDLHLRAIHDKNNSLDQTPNGWTTHRMNDGDSDNGDFVTSKYGARTGANSLAFGKFFSIWVRTDATLSGLDANKTYSLTAWVRKQGNTPVAQMYACAPAETSVPFANASLAAFHNSEDYVQYVISGIAPTADGKCKIGFEVKADPYALTLVDDVVFTAEDGSTGNLAPNPGFEQADPINYSSGGIIGRNTMKYGYMEARAKGAPALPGACSAIWLAGRTEEWGTEIDVLEIGQTSRVKELDFALHTYKSLPTSANPAYDLRDPHRSIGIEKTNNAFDPSSAYHVYGLEWGPGYQKFYVDGTLVAQFYGNTKVSEAGEAAAPQQKSTDLADMLNEIPLYPHLSLGLRPPYRDADIDTLDTTFDVDYIRVWRANNTGATGDIQEVVSNDGSVVVPAGLSPLDLADRLPATVPVMVGAAGQGLSLKNQRDVAVVWDLAPYADTIKGHALTITGTLSDLPAGVTNTQNIVPSLVVHVQNDLTAIKDTAREAIRALTAEVQGLDRLSYEGGSWRAVQDALTAAQNALADETASDETLQAAYMSLQNAKSGLLTLPEGVPVPEESDTVKFVDNTDPSVRYTGDWENGRGELANNKYLKSQHFTQNAVGTTISHTFTGTGVDVISGTSARLADLTVTIRQEGNIVDTVSGISCQSAQSGRMVAYSKQDLPHGTYEVTLTFTSAAENGYTRGEFDGFFIYNNAGPASGE